MTFVQDEHFSRWPWMASVLITLLTTSVWAQSTISGGVSQVAGATHFEFKGISNWNYKILPKTTDNKVTLVVPPFDQSTEVALKSWSDTTISNITVEKERDDGQYGITLQLTAGNIDSFDYLTDEPSRLIIDVFVNESTVEKVQSTVSTDKKKDVTNPDISVQKVKAQKVTSEEAELIAKKGGYKRKNRAPASSELMDGEMKNLAGSTESEDGLELLRGVFDGGDPSYKRFRVKPYEVKEEAIIASKQNIYIRFPMLKLQTSMLPEIVANPPEYVIKPRDDRENKEARLLLTLFNNKRYAVFLRTYNYFIAKYPHSEYDEIVRNLLADVHYQLWLRDKAFADYDKFKSTLEYLNNKYPDSVMTERADLMLAYSALERKDGVETLQRFMRFIEKYSTSTSRDQARKAIADAYLLLRKNEEALAVLAELEKMPDVKLSGVEANYRRGDVYFEKGDLEKAIDTYKESVARNPAQESVFANANYNIAESQFWLGRYTDSLDSYIRFVELFPAHEHASYALTRIGELLQILGASEEKIMGAFQESYYRFNKSEGAEIARIRMLSQRMPEMKEKEMGKALEEMSEIAKHSKLPRMAEFVTLMVADGLHGRGEYEKALNHLITYYQKNPTTTDVTFFKKRILRNISDLMSDGIENKDFMEVLDINSKYAMTWLRKSDRLDTKYFVGRAYEMAGVYNDAFEIYDQTLKKLKEIKGTTEEKERKVNEHLPSIEKVNLRLASVATNLRRYSEASDHLDEIRSDKNLSPIEKVEFVEISALVAERRGLIEVAKENLKDLIKEWKDNPEPLATTYLKLAELQYDSKNYSESEIAIQEIERIKESEAKVNEDVWFDTLSLKAKVYLAQKRFVGAVESYEKIIDEYDGKRSLDLIKYKAGLTLFETGNLKSAEKMWSTIHAEKGAMYKELADEKLSNARWEDDYKRYIKRIPAAASLDGGNQ